MAIQLSAGVLAVLQVIAAHGPISPHEICDKVDLSPRTVTLALGTLTEKKLCQKIPNLADMRKPLYFLDSEKSRQLLAEYGLDSLIRSPPTGIGPRP
ncbi:MAG: MarR family winged helix-turn-helix transcriptional regulator [Candidatus Thorarchaeota archaeon]